MICPQENDPPYPPGKPRLGGSRIVEIGRQVFVHISNGDPGQQVTLFRDIQLSASVPECDGDREIGPAVATYTFDGNGEVIHLDPNWAAYDPALIGTTLYFQARAEAFLIYPCRLSTVMEVAIHDRTDTQTVGPDAEDEVQ